MKFQYTHTKSALSKAWNEEEDRYMICMLEKLGMDKENVYEEIKRHLRNAPEFRFDWFIKSRSTAEINKRCQFLLSIIEKEFRTENQGEKRKAGGANGPAKKKVKT